MTHQEFLETCRKGYCPLYITITNNEFSRCEYVCLSYESLTVQAKLTENTYLFHYFENYIFNIATNDKLFKVLSKDFKK